MSLIENLEQIEERRQQYEKFASGLASGLASGFLREQQSIRRTEHEPHHKLKGLPDRGKSILASLHRLCVDCHKHDYHANHIVLHHGAMGLVCAESDAFRKKFERAAFKGLAFFEYNCAMIRVETDGSLYAPSVFMVASDRKTLVKLVFDAVLKANVQSTGRITAVVSQKLLSNCGMKEASGNAFQYAMLRSIKPPFDTPTLITIEAGCTYCRTPIMIKVEGLPIWTYRFLTKLEDRYLDYLGKAQSCDDAIMSGTKMSKFLGDRLRMIRGNNITLMRNAISKMNSIGCASHSNELLKKHPFTKIRDNHEMDLHNRRSVRAQAWKIPITNGPGGA